MKKIRTRITLCLIGAFFAFSIYAQDKADEVWRVNRSIPLPDQASELLLEAIKKGGQPNVEANSKLSFSNALAWNEAIEEMSKGMLVFAKQETERLNITVKEETITGVTVRYVTPPSIEPRNENRLFIHTHGGAYVLGGGYTGIAEALYLAHYLKMPVVSIDYRMPPSHPFPAAVDDVLTVYKELIKQHDPKTMALGGSSAGGGLAMAFIHNFKAEGLELPGVLYLGTPWSDIDKIGDSYFTNEGIDQALVCYEGVLEGAAHLYAGDYDLKNPLISPIYGDFSGFPPTYLVTGTRDLFLSNTVLAHRKLRIAGVIADLNVYEGLSHGQNIRLFDSPENIQVHTELGEFLHKYLR